MLGIDFFSRVYEPDSKIVVLRDVEAAVIAVVDKRPRVGPPPGHGVSHIATQGKTGFSAISSPR